MQVPPGGPATINGILYQMLWSLLEVLHLRIEDCDSDSTGNIASQAFLILEPPGGGGDLLVRGSNIEVVQQLKARSDGRAWSLREIVTEVLPDLYRAVKLDRAQKFLFITEGKMGMWKEALDFFQSLGQQPVAAADFDILNFLEPFSTICFRGALTDDGGTVSRISGLELFSQITAILREKEPARSENVSVTHQKLWKLLGSLEFRWEQTAPMLSARLRQRLRAVIDDADHIDQTLDALIALLARQASQGNAVIETEKFLSGHSLSSLPLTSWHRLVEASTSLLEKRLPLFRYRPAENVRTPLENEVLKAWRRGSSPFLILSGESGQGKTWQLIQLARSLTLDVPVVVLEAIGSGKENKEEAARLFWQGVANHDGSRDLERIAQRVQETIPIQFGCWLFIFVDNVRTYAEAEEIYRAFRPVPGIRIAFTTSTNIASRFATKFEQDTRVLPVSDFTDPELRRYVVDGDAKAWHDIPLDIRAVIRRPLLADLYRSLTSNKDQAPNTEYKLYDQYYRQRLADPLLELFPTAFISLRRAALAAWQGDLYPWSLEQLETFGLVDPALVRFLIEIGWLRRDEHQNYQVWHDRLLSWQVAEAVVNAFERGEQNPTAFGQRCAARFYNPSVDKEGQRLGYVLMDVVWMMAKRGTSMADALDTILQQMEGDFRVASNLYEHLLSTVGDSIAPSLFRRLETGGQPAIQAGYVVSALEKLTTAAVAPDAIRLLTSDNVPLRQNAMRLLSHHPSADALELLWQRYVNVVQQNDERKSERGGEREYLWERLSLWPALEACAPLNPSWLEEKIRATSPLTGELAGSLVALLCIVPDGRNQWHQLKEILRQHVIGGGERHFATAAYRWSDGNEVKWLQERVAIEDNMLGACCLRALIRIASQAALTSLGDLSPEELSSTRKWTINLLWACRPRETAERIRELMQGRAETFWDYANTFCDLPNAMDETTYKLLLDTLLPRMDIESAEELHIELRRVAKVTRLALLRCLHQRAGTAWEMQLTRLLVEEDPNPAGWRDVVQKDAQLALYKTGGTGFTRLVNHWLANGDMYARREGIDAAFKRPDAETIRLLEAVSAEGHDGEREDGSDYDSRIAQLALARSGAWHSVVETIIMWQGNSHREIIFARWQAEPLSEEDLQPALVALKKNSKHPGAILALGFGQRTEYLDFIVLTLTEENTEIYTDVVNACLWALAALPKVPSEVVGVLAPRLSQIEGRRLVVSLLIREGSVQAAQVLMNFLHDQLETPLTYPYSVTIIDDAILAARFLLRNTTTGAEAAALCRQRIGRDAEPDFVAQRLIQATLSDKDDNEEETLSLPLHDERTQNFLARNAFQDSGFIHYAGERARAIRGLAAFAPLDAYEAALRVLKNPNANDRDRSPGLLLELDQTRAVSDILELLAVERRTLLRRACARALCTAGATNDLCERHIISADASRREATCFTLGYAAPSEAVLSAVRTCLADEDMRVFEAACEAVRRLYAAQCTGELVTTYLNTDDAAEQWILLDSALETGDVFDVSWLRRMLQNAPPLTVQYVQEQVEKRRKEEEQEAGTEDWRNHVS